MVDNYGYVFPGNGSLDVNAPFGCFPDGFVIVPRNLSTIGPVFLGGVVDEVARSGDRFDAFVEFCDVSDISVHSEPERGSFEAGWDAAIMFMKSGELEDV